MLHVVYGTDRVLRAAWLFRLQNSCQPTRTISAEERDIVPRDDRPAVTLQC